MNLHSMLHMTDLNLNQKRVIIREDLNVPLQNGHITDDNRIKQALPTLKLARECGARTLILSHLGQPKTAQYDPALSLAPIAEALSQALGQPIHLVADWLSGVEIAPGEIALAENVRFLPGEIENSPDLAKKMAAQCDVFVMDAFATAHRAQASTTGMSEFAKIACAGPLLIAELNALSQVLDRPQSPVLAIVGGSKVSSKIQVLDQLLNKVDTLIVGGGIANTLLAAMSLPIGQSLFEADWLSRSQALIEHAKSQSINLPLPVDVAVAQQFNAEATATIKNVSEVASDDKILDIGPKTIALYSQYIQKAKTIIWNGPVGVFEFPAFSHGTAALAKSIANSQAFSLAGGGDTVAAINQFGVGNQISYISTGGGAFLELLEGKTLPALAALIANKEKCDRSDD